MTKLFFEDDAQPVFLEDQRVAVIGYGSQGRAQALNLRESGIDVSLGLRPKGATWAKSIEDGWAPRPMDEAAAEADCIVMLVPDMSQPEVYAKYIAPGLRRGNTLLFSHGFNIFYRQFEAPAGIDVSMVAPKAPGKLVRREYEAGRGVPCLVAVHHDASGRAFDRALAYAHGIGGTRAGVFRTTFAEETETDLFGEQAVLCGGMSELVTAGFETLVRAGYSQEAAYFECLHEMKLIVDLMYEGGLARVHEFVSETARWGDLSRGPRVVDDRVRANMRMVLEEIQTGQFAREWVAEHAAGRPNYNRLLQADLEHPIEQVGRALRSRMAWIQRDRTPETAGSTS